MNSRLVLSFVLVVAAGVVGNCFRFIERTPGRTADFTILPLQTGGYVGKEVALGQTTHDILRATSTTMREYLSPDGIPCNLFMGYFRSQKFGSGIHSPKHCLPGGGWNIQTQQPFILNLDDGTAKDVNCLRITFGERKKVMLYWFETRSGAVRSEYSLKFDLIKNALAMRPTDAAIIRITVPILDGDTDKATQRAVDFFRTLYPYINQALPF